MARKAEACVEAFSDSVDLSLFYKVWVDILYLILFKTDLIRIIIWLLLLRWAMLPLGLLFWFVEDKALLDSSPCYTILDTKLRQTNSITIRFFCVPRRNIDEAKEVKDWSKRNQQTKSNIWDSILCYFKHLTTSIYRFGIQ